MPDKIVVILGPTASGKSALAVRLARKFNGEIISADSRQVYRGLDIGSGKLEVKKRGGVKHHLLDVTNPKRTFTVAQYQKLAGRALRGIIHRGRLPIICGGTGFYVEAILGRVTIPPVPPNQALRARLEKLRTEKLFEKLKVLNPIRAKNIDSHNRRRLIRAIEIAQMLNTRCLTKYPTPNVGQGYPRECFKIGIFIEKEELKEKIHTRLMKRMRQGLVAEVRRLRAGGLSWKRLDDLGLEYRYVAGYLRGLITKEQMIHELETAIWHYAKRQLTWWKRDKTIRWVKNYREAEQLTMAFLKKSGKMIR